MARFLSAPGPWPKDKLAELLCHDLAGADSVEAVLHGRLKRQNPYYDPADFAQAVPVEGTTVAIEGERIPIEALKPAKEMRITANDDFRQMRERERLRKAGAEGGPRG